MLNSIRASRFGIPFFSHLICSVTVVGNEAVISQHYHNKGHHVPVLDGLQQFNIKSTIPDDVISSCQVNDTTPAFSVLGMCLMS